MEKSAVKQVIQRIEQGEGTIVTSRLAKEVGITRTVIVNALKKVESAGLIQTKSYGVKGTHIKVMNDKIYTDFVTQKWKWISDDANGIVLFRDSLCVFIRNSLLGGIFYGFVKCI